MSDLISRSDVLDVLNKRKHLANIDYDLMEDKVDLQLRIGYVLQELDELTEMVECIPTAYDSEKVVEELEEHSMIGYVSVGVATRIVRKGGVE